MSTVYCDLYSGDMIWDVSGMRRRRGIAARMRDKDSKRMPAMYRKVGHVVGE